MPKKKRKDKKVIRVTSLKKEKRGKEFLTLNSNKFCDVPLQSGLRVASPVHQPTPHHAQEQPAPKKPKSGQGTADASSAIEMTVYVFTFNF